MRKNNDSAKNTYKVEKATLADVPYIQALNKILFEYEIQAGNDDNLDPDWSFSDEGKQEIQERITNENSSCGFIVKDKSQIIGYLIGRILKEETGRNRKRRCGFPSSVLRYRLSEYTVLHKLYRSAEKSGPIREED